MTCVRLLSISFFLAFSAIAVADPSVTKQKAAALFEQGKDSYRRGDYQTAISFFIRAHRLSPHFSVLFNIARCYENLGNLAQALKHYQEAFDRATDAQNRADIRQRMKQLRNRPVKVFLSSHPPGATVFVDAEKAPRASKTPLVLELTPGPHLLYLQRENHKALRKRIEVEIGKAMPVEVTLVAESDNQTHLPFREAVSQPPLIDPDNLHIHLSVPAAFGKSIDRPLAAGTGVQLVGTFRHLMFGGHFLAFPMIEQSIARKTLDDAEFDSVKFSWLFFQVEGGMLFPLKYAYIYTTLGAGFSADRIVFRGRQLSGEKRSVDFVKEQFAFIWSLGGGIESMVTRWLSIGAAIRLGLIHGNRSDKDKLGEPDRQHHFPYGSIWGSVTFHL